VMGSSRCGRGCEWRRRSCLTSRPSRSLHPRVHGAAPAVPPTRGPWVARARDRPRTCHSAVEVRGTRSPLRANRRHRVGHAECFVASHARSVPAR
jgi:hypothetical protein